MASIDDEDELKATRRLNGVDKNIKVGEYVRTKQGIIVKCIEEKADRYLFDKIVIEEGYYNDYIFKDISDRANFIAKHSPNLIDIIEVDDYVNGMLVQKIVKPSLANDYRTLIYCNECEGLYKGIFDNKEIKTIVTREQFNSVAYRVEE